RPSCRTLSGSSNLDATATSDVYTLSLHDALPISPFSADDVKFSIDRAMAEGSVNPQKGLYSAIDTVEVVDPATVVITLKHPQGAFLWNMGWGEAAIASPASADNNKEHPIGTGPFKFESWAKGSSIKLVKNPDYWGEPVALERAEFRIVPDAAR